VLPEIGLTTRLASREECTAMNVGCDIERLVPRRAAALVLAAAVGTGCLYEMDAPKTEGRDIRLTFLHTSDIHSRIFPYDHDPLFTEQRLGLLPDRGPYGGMARIAHVVKREREKASRAIWLDSGDLFQGAPVFNEFLGEAEVRSLSVAGLDAFALGNHEFDAGPRNVARQFADYASFPVLAANYRFETARQPFARDFNVFVHPFVIFNLDGVKVGVIGMGNLSSMNSLDDGDNSLGILPLETLETVQAYTNVLRQSVDLVVLVGHLGLGEDEFLARNVCGLDLILGGHHHVVLHPPKLIPFDRDPEIVFGGEIEVDVDALDPAMAGEGRDFGTILNECPDEWKRETLLAHPGAFAKYVARLDVVVRDDRIRSHRFELFPIDATVPEDPDVSFVLEEYQQELDRRLNLDVVLTTATQPLRRFGSSGGDSMLGNFMAEAMQFRPFVETDFCVTNSLGIRTDILEGDVTLEQMFNAMPFENTIATMQMSGVEVQELLDFSTERSAARGCTSQIQVSGVRFTMNCRTGKAEDIEINGQPLSPSGVYELCTNDYIASGGSGFKVLQRNTTTINTGISLRSAVIDEMRRHPELPACLNEDETLETCTRGVALSDGRIRTRF
jgi:5'-nucleotidase / UDP-sugar diphosphatase